MRRIIPLLVLGATLGLAGPATAEEHEIRMLNKGEKGVMVFEPDFVRAAPGDTIRFVATHKSHNAELIKGMMPEGAQHFRGKMNEEFTVKLREEGVYGIKCAPHYGMGMVALVVVGDATNQADAQSVKHPGKARQVFAELFGQQLASK